MFIQTEATPNPATLKFLPGQTVLETGTLDLRDAADATKSPLAERLFAIKGINAGRVITTTTTSSSRPPTRKSSPPSRT